MKESEEEIDYDLDLDLDLLGPRSPTPVEVSVVLKKVTSDSTEGTPAAKPVETIPDKVQTGPKPERESTPSPNVLDELELEPIPEPESAAVPDELDVEPAPKSPPAATTAATTAVPDELELEPIAEAETAPDPDKFNLDAASAQAVPDEPEVVEQSPKNGNVTAAGFEELELTPKSSTDEAIPDELELEPIPDPEPERTPASGGDLKAKPESAPEPASKPESAKPPSQSKPAPEPAAPAPDSSPPVTESKPAAATEEKPASKSPAPAKEAPATPKVATIPPPKASKSAPPATSKAPVEAREPEKPGHVIRLQPKTSSVPLASELDVKEKKSKTKPAIPEKRSTPKASRSAEPIPTIDEIVDDESPEPVIEFAPAKKKRKAVDEYEIDFEEEEFDSTERTPDRPAARKSPSKKADEDEGKIEVSKEALPEDETKQELELEEPLDEESSEPKAKPKAKRRKKGRWIKRLLIGVPVALVLLLVALAAAFYFAGDVVLRTAWPLIESRLAAKGLYVGLGEIGKDPERGITFKEVVIYQDEGRTARFAELSEVAVKPLYFNKELGGPIAADVSFEDSFLQLNTGDTNPRLKGLAGGFLVGSEAITFDDSLAAELNGISLNVSGETTWESASDAFATKSEEEKEDEDGPAAATRADEKLNLASLDLRPLDELVRYLTVTGEGAPLQVNLTVDGKDDRPFTATAKTSGQNLVWRDIPVSSIALEFDAEDAGKGLVIDAPKVNLAALGGSIDTRLKADLHRQQLTVSSLTSNIDWHEFLSRVDPELAKEIAMISFPSPPQITGSGTINLTEPSVSDFLMNIDCENGLTVTPENGDPVTIESLSVEATLRDSKIVANPISVQGLFGGNLDAAIAATPFEESPRAQATFAAKHLETGALSSFLGDPSGSSNTVSLGGSLSLRDSQLRFSDVQLVHAERNLTTHGFYDIDTSVLRLDSLKSDVHLVSLARDLMPSAAESISTIATATGPIVDMNGTFDLAEIEASKADVFVQSDEGLVLNVDGKPLPVTKVRFRALLAEELMTVDNLSFNTLGGSVGGAVKARVFHPSLPFSMGLGAENISLPELGKLTGQKKEIPGTGALSISGTGTTDIKTINAQGTLDIADAEFYAFPLFGKIFDRINNLKIRKGETGYARGPFTISNGVLDTSKLNLRAANKQIMLLGKVDLGEQRYDLDVLLQDTGIVGVATNDTLGNMNVSVRGPFSNPDIKVGVKGGVTEGALKVAGDTTEIMGDVVNNGAQIVNRAVGDTARAAEGVVRNGVGNLNLPNLRNRNDRKPPAVDPDSLVPATGPSGDSSATPSPAPAPPPQPAPAEKERIIERLNPFKRNR